MSIANYITLIRVASCPLFMLIYMSPALLGISAAAMPYYLLLFLIVIELSDLVDGYVARKFNQVTDFGKVFDPMADSITRLAVFLTFTQPPVHLPVPLIFIFLYRDSVISTLRTLCALRGVALAARTSGKIKAAVQASAAFLIVLLMIAQLYDKITTSQLQELSFMIAAIAAIYTLLSGIEYIYANRHYIGSALSTSQEAQP